MARIAPLPWAEMLNADCTTMSVASPPPIRLPMNDVSSSGNAVQCSPRRRTSGWPSTNAQIVRSVRRKKPTPPSRRVASATNDPLSRNSERILRPSDAGKRSRSRWRCSSERAWPLRSTTSSARWPSKSSGARFAARRCAGYSKRRRGSSWIASVMTTPWVRSWDSTRVPLSSSRYSIVSAMRSVVTGRPGAPA